MDSDSGSSDQGYIQPKYSERPKTAKKIGKNSKKILKTAKVPSVLYTPLGKNKKVDRLKAFLMRKQEWDSQSFLKGNSQSTKEGRKLNLADGNHVKFFEIVRRTSVHDFRNFNFIPPHEKRRDSLRRQIRMKMLRSSNSVLS